MNLIENLNWRYATKKFDPNRKVSNTDLELIKQAVQLSASSYGLQLYKVLVISDQATKEKLMPASWNQSQLTDSSHVFVFCNYTEVKSEHIDEFMQLVAEKRNFDEEKIIAYSQLVKSKLSKKSAEEVKAWLKAQTYLALGNLLTACAELKIDACPMEGFESDKYNEILKLEEKGLNAALVATIGYRHQEDLTQHLAKVRKPTELLFEHI